MQSKKANLLFTFISLFILLFSFFYYLKGFLKSSYTNFLIFLLLFLPIFYLFTKLIPKIINKIKIKNKKIRLLNLILINFLSLISISELILIFNENSEIKNYILNNFFSSQINIIFKISSLLGFYFLFLLLFSSFGEKILKLFKIKIKEKSENFLLSLGVGLMPFSLLMFGLGLLSLFNPYAISALVLSFAVFCWKEIKNNLVFLKNKKIEFDFENNKKSYLLLFFVWLIFNIMLIANFAPIPTDGDSLNVYFNDAVLFSEYGQFKPLHHHSLANTYKNTEMIYVAIIILASTFHVTSFQIIFFGILLFGIYIFFKKNFGKKMASLGIFSVFLTPWTFYYPTTAKVEIFLTFFIFLALYCYWEYIKKRDKKLLYLLGIILGFSIGIKYTALFFAFSIFFIIFVVNLKEKNKKENFKNLFFSIFLMILIISPWAIKNQIYFGNIFYPQETFQKNKINPIGLEKDAEMRKKIRKELNYLRHGIYPEKYTLKNLISVFWGQSVGTNITTGFWINFGYAIFLTIPLYLFYLKNKKIILISSPFLGTILFWFITFQSRPWYVLFSILFLYALLPIILKKNKISLFFYFCSIVFIFLCFSNILIRLKNTQYLIGSLDKEKYEKQLSYYDTAKYINNLNLDEKEKILFVESNFIYLIKENDKMARTDTLLIESAQSLSLGIDNFYKDLRKNDFKYIITKSEKFPEIYDTPETRKKLEKKLGSYNWGSPNFEEIKSTFKKFLEQKTNLIHKGNFYNLYKINEE